MGAFLGAAFGVAAAGAAGTGSMALALRQFLNGLSKVGLPLVITSNVVQHHEDPGKMLQHIALDVALFGVTILSVRGLMRSRAPSRLPQDVDVNPAAPSPLPLNRPISRSATQNAALQRDIAAAKAAGGRDFRVNQQQVNAAGQRVGLNRPDLQYTDANGRRIYVEYDTTSSTRGPIHETRILANDPNGTVILKVVD